MFQALISEILPEFLYSCHIYIDDDILIDSKFEKEHIKQVRAVLRNAIENNRYVTFKKCECHQRSVKFLGYVIDKNGTETILAGNMASTITHSTVAELINKSERLEVLRTNFHEYPLTKAQLIWCWHT